LGWLFVIFIVTTFGCLVAHALQQGKIRRERSSAFIASRQGWDLYVSPYGRKVLGLSPDTGELVLGTVQQPLTYKVTDVASVQVIKDGATVTSTNRSAQLAGAAIGGLTLGGVGLLLGGLSGSRRSRSTISSLAIKIIVDDRTAPVHTVQFFRSPSNDGTTAQSPLLRPSLEAVDRYHALVVNALRKAQPAVTAAPGLPVATSTDQIGRLWDLKQAGAITDEEFAAHKSRLLANLSKAQAG